MWMLNTPSHCLFLVAFFWHQCQGWRAPGDCQSLCWFSDIEGWRPFSDWSSLGWIGRLVFAKKMNTTNPHQDFFFWPTIVFWQMKGHPVLTVCFLQNYFCPNWFQKIPFQTLGLQIIQERNQPWAGTWDLHLKFFLKLKDSGWQQNKTTNKQKHMKTHTHAWATMNIHGHPWALERAWAAMNSHEVVFFQIQCSWQIVCWIICLTVFELLILGCWLCEFLV